MASIGGGAPVVDLAEKMLELARAKAIQRDLDNTEFRLGDILDLRLPGAHFDAVVCVFGIFFVPDMPAAVRALWERVRPGGKLARNASFQARWYYLVDLPEASERHMATGARRESPSRAA